jgi:exopolysaccharide production protein ExoZ
LNGDHTKSRFVTLELGRAVAASLVVLHHAGNIMAQPRFYGEHPFSGHLQNFNVGIDFFFVLSGFIITWVHWRDIGDPSRLGNYAAKRFLRIYPPYWGVMIPLAILYVGFPSAGIPSQRDPLNIALSIFLLPAAPQPVLGVAWTLVHEVFFYAVFAGVIAAGRFGLAVFAMWALAILAIDRLGESTFPLSFFASPFNLDFIMGVCAAALLKSRRILLPAVLFVAGIASFSALMLFAPHIQDDSLVSRLAFGGSAFFALLGLVALELRRPIRLPQALVLFGAASYSVYLVHPVVLSFGVHILSRAPAMLPDDAIALVLAASGIGAGFLYYKIFEPALTAMARNTLSKAVSFLTQSDRII